MDYRVTVRNTGNTELSLGALSESGCESVVPGGPVRVAVGASQAYTCEHKGLAVGAYASVASVSNDSEASRESNKLEVEVPAQPGFVVEAEQKLEGEVGYTRGRLVGRVGETVDYKVTVRNTGNTELSLGALSESGCESVVPGGPVRVAVGASQAYTCEHKGLAVGAYASVASVSNDSEASRESNKLEVEVPAQPGFVVEAEQKLEGEVGYTRGRLVGRVGETVDYKVTVRNTGNTELSLGALSESGCESVVPGGPVRVAVGASQAYTCEHKGLAVGAYASVASVSNDSEASRESNKVEVEVPAQPMPTVRPMQEVTAVCKVSEASIQLHRVEGEHKKPFNAWISSLGIEKITFYIDGKRYKTLKSSQARKGRFTIKIDPRKYSYGTHKVSVKTVMKDSNCAEIARSAPFARAKPEKRVA